MNYIYQGNKYSRQELISYLSIFGVLEINDRLNMRLDHTSKVVDENGEPLVVHHGTKANRFHEFDMNKLGEGTDQYGSGFYFSNDKLIAQGYGDNIYDVFLNIRHPINPKRKLTYQEIKKIITKSPILKDALYNFGDVDYEGQYVVLDKAVKGYIGYGDEVMHSLNAISNDFFKGEEQHFLKAIKDVLGFDGNIVKLSEESTVYVAFEPTQIKLADGSNTTFDKNNPDIRFENGGNINSDAFKKWFADSKVVNEDKTPQIVYHGTSAKFNKFNIKKTTQGIIWFTSDKSAIERGEVGAQGKGHIMELYASIQNPAGWKEYEKYGLGQLKGLGYDGVILPEKDGNFVGFVFDPTKLKSATNNKGTFDPNNSDIRYDGGGKTKDKNLILYHGTSLKHLNKILQEGLISNLGYGAGWYMLSSDFESALFHANSINEGDDVAVIEFSIPIGDNDRWKGYPYLWKGEERTDHSTWYAPMKAIPKKFIKKVHRIKYSDWLKQKSEGFANGGIMSNSDLITKYNLYGKGIPVRFANDKKIYYTKNISYDQKTVFVTDNDDVTTNKKIKNIVEIGGRSIERREASGRWTDASYSARYDKKSSSRATQSQASDDTISPRFNSKDKNNSDTGNENNKKLLMGGKTAIFGAFYDKNHDIIGVGRISGEKFYYDSFTNDIVSIGFTSKEIDKDEYEKMLKKHAQVMEEGGKVVTSDGSQGGMFVGPAHSEGGMPTIVSGTNERIEVEGREPLLVPKIFSIKKKIRCVGKPKSIVSTVNQIAGGANFSEEQAQCKIIGEEGETEKMDMGNKVKYTKTITEISGDVVSAPSGSAVINKTSTALPDLYECEGTPAGIASAVNEIGKNGVHFADHGKCRLVKKQLK